MILNLSHSNCVESCKNDSASPSCILHTGGCPWLFEIGVLLVFLSHVVIKVKTILGVVKLLSGKSHPIGGNQPATILTDSASARASKCTA